MVVRVDSAPSTIRFEDETEHRADEQPHLEMHAHIPAVKPANVEIHPTFHRMVNRLTDMPVVGILGMDPSSTTPIKVPEEPSDLFLILVIGKISQHLFRSHVFGGLEIGFFVQFVIQTDQ